MQFTCMSFSLSLKGFSGIAPIPSEFLFLRNVLNKYQELGEGHIEQMTLKTYKIKLEEVQITN